MNKKLFLKIAAFVTAIVLIGIILSITNAFVGNPISSSIADKKIKEYVAQNYSSLELEVEKAHYNFKFNHYMARAKSKTSVDTHFTIYHQAGKEIIDDYETYVLGKYNTLTRLEKEYSQFVIPILAKISELENNTSMVKVEKWEYEKTNEDIQIDMKFDKDLPIDMKITIRADLNDVSLKNIANILEKSHHILVNNGCVFTAYDIFSEHEGILVMVNNVTPSDIESGQLEKILQDAQNYQDKLDRVVKKDNEEPVERIRVFIKDSKDKK